MIGRIVVLVFIGFFAFFPLNVFAVEMKAIPEKEVFAPNDWIRIFFEIDGYAGGDISWLAHKPDNSTESGILDNIRYGKINHIIVRNAFDNQFGGWLIEYQYKDTTQTVPVTVEPLEVEASTNKNSYNPDEKVILSLTTNYFEPKAHLSEDFVIQVFDKHGELANAMDELKIGAIQNVTKHEFSVFELIENNPPGLYTVNVQYFNVIEEVSFEIIDNEELDVFVGSEKSLYQVGDKVVVKVIVSEVVGSKGTITVEKPYGEIITNSFTVNSSITTITLDDVTTNQFGTYIITVEYAGTVATDTFMVK